MDVVRYNFGEYTPIDRTKGEHVTVWIDNKHWVLDDPLREAPSDYWSDSDPPVERGPFVLSDFGDRDRLSWGVAACLIEQNTKLFYWANRYVAWTGDSTLTIIDATRSLVATITLPLVVHRFDKLMGHGGRLWAPGRDSVVSIAMADLEALIDRSPGPIEVCVRERYPRRRVGRIQKATVVDVDSLYARAQFPGALRALEFPRLEGIELGTEVTLYDQLVRGKFLEIEYRGRPRRPLYGDLLADTLLDCTLTIEPAVDPLGAADAPPAEIPFREEDLDRLLNELADSPNEPALRTVIVDMLEDAGLNHAPLLARLVAGEFDLALQREALGVLANFLEGVEFRAGLPVSATLVESPPLDPDIVATVVADHRLGFFHTLRIGSGPFAIYAKLVGSPRAVGLRHVDVPNTQVLAALVAAKRDRLAHLSGAKFATREMADGLANPLFDRVVLFDLETAANIVSSQLEYIRTKVAFFTRAPRHLVLHARTGSDVSLLEPALAAWPTLPVARLSVAGITLARDGTARVAETASQVAVDRVSKAFRIVASTDVLRNGGA